MHHKTESLHLGITRACPLAIGPMSKNAKVLSVSTSLKDGMSPLFERECDSARSALDYERCDFPYKSLLDDFAAEASSIHQQRSGKHKHKLTTYKMQDASE